MSEASIETTRKVWIGEGYFIIRPWPDDHGCIELCTEPGDNSGAWFGTFSITIGTPEAARCIAKALELAAADMEAGR
jgi:hypothetical protein